MDKQKATALELLDEALRTKREAVQMFDEIKSQTAENLRLLARCESLIRNAAEVSPKVRTGAMAEQAEELTADSEQLAEAIRNRNCHDVILGIMQLAMLNYEYIHINADYSAHVNTFDIAVYDSETKYEGDQKAIHRQYIHLVRNRHGDDATPLQQLLQLEDKLLDLIAEAKDKAEVAA